MVSRPISRGVRVCGRLGVVLDALTVVVDGVANVRDQNLLLAASFGHAAISMCWCRRR